MKIKALENKKYFIFFFFLSINFKNNIMSFEDEINDKTLYEKKKINK